MLTQSPCNFEGPFLVDFNSCAGTVIPNLTSLEYDENSEFGFFFNDVSVPEATTVSRGRTPGEFTEKSQPTAFRIQ